MPHLNDTTPAAKSGSTPVLVAVAPASDPTPPAVRAPVLIPPANFELAEQKRNQWFGTVPAGTTAEDLHLDPAPFALVASILTRGDDVRLITSDEKLMIDLVCVVGTRGSLAMCHVIGTVALPAVSYSHTLPPNHEVRRATPDESHLGGFVAVRKDPETGQEVILSASESFHDYESCRAFLVNHASLRGATNPALHRLPYRP